MQYAVRFQLVAGGFLIQALTQSKESPFFFRTKATRMWRISIQSFAGNDAVYDRFFLAALPGCQRLAGKYLPED